VNILEIARVAGLLASTLGEQEMYRGKKRKHYGIEIRIACINITKSCSCASYESIWGGERHLFITLGLLQYSVC
jgi:hypothetical protein